MGIIFKDIKTTHSKFKNIIGRTFLLKKGKGLDLIEM
jgi:hypothetical protein